MFHCSVKFLRYRHDSTQKPSAGEALRVQYTVLVLPSPAKTLETHRVVGAFRRCLLVSSTFLITPSVRRFLWRPASINVVSHSNSRCLFLSLEVSRSFPAYFWLVKVKRAASCLHKRSASDPASIQGDAFIVYSGVFGVCILNFSAVF